MVQLNIPLQILLLFELDALLYRPFIRAIISYITLGFAFGYIFTFDYCISLLNIFSLLNTDRFI